MAKTKTISFPVWKTLFRDTVSAFPKVWWRIASVNIFIILTLIVGTAIFAGVGYAIFGNTIENLIANISFGGSLVGFLPLIGIVILWALFVTVFSANGKIANTLVLKNYTKKKKNRSPFKIYFVDTWHYLGRYIALTLHIIWYLAWPIILVMGAGTILMPVSMTDMVQFEDMILLFWGTVGILFLWRLVHIVFMKSTLVNFDKDTKSTFKAMIKLVKGNWWGVFLSVVGFVVAINIVRVLFLIPENVFFVESLTIFAFIFALLDFLFSFFVLAPLIITFMYLFMLHLSKTKKIKP